LRKNMDEVEYSVKELKGRLHTAMKDKFPLLDTHEGRIASLERRLRKNRISSLEQRLRKNMDEVEETVDDLQGKLAAIVEKKSPVPGDHAGRNSSRQQP
jgi:response regulator RpfG family c-di-GMP phosphodiesterase